MKLFVFVLIIVATSAFAVDAELGPRHAEGTGMVSIDGLVYSQTFDLANLMNAYSNYGAGDRWVCDDFVLAGPDTMVDAIIVWMIWTGAQGTTMNIVFSKDNGDFDPNTAIEIWAEAVPSTNYPTGEIVWGFDVFQTTCAIDGGPYPNFQVGRHYWLETQADVVDNCFMLVGTWSVLSYVWYNDGSGVWVRSDAAFGENTDAFFDLWWDWTALESSTWGDIKTLF